MSDAGENQLRPLIEQAFEDRSKLESAEYRSAVEETIELLDKGKLRVATRGDDGEWTVHAWTKQAILLYFGIRGMERVEVGAYEYHDKIPLKRGYQAAGVRVVPPATVRRRISVLLMLISGISTWWGSPEPTARRRRSGWPRISCAPRVTEWA